MFTHTSLTLCTHITKENKKKTVRVRVWFEVNPTQQISETEHNEKRICYICKRQEEQKRIVLYEQKKKTTNNEKRNTALSLFNNK
jgi:hypothetical protein